MVMNSTGEPADWQTEPGSQECRINQLEIHAQVIRSASQLIVEGPICVVVLISTQGFQDQIPFLDRKVRVRSGAV